MAKATQAQSTPAKAEQPTREYYDNSRLSDYKNCPRYYYLRHIRGWVSEAKSKALIFGAAWHGAMSALWVGFRKLPLSKLLPVAMEGFWQTWIEEGGPPNMDLPTLEEWGARTPITAENMLVNYASQREAILKKATIIADEQPFAVPIFPNNNSVWYIGKKDKKIILNNEGIVVEHKTTTEYRIEGGFKGSYLDSFSPNSQVEGYLYSERFEKKYPAGQVWIDAALVHRKVHDKFKFIPVSKVSAGLEGWVWEARDWIGRIQSENERLGSQEEQAKQSHMTAFPKQTEHCVGKYGPCQFLNICRSTQNPEKIPETEVPSGYKVDFWEPFDVLGLDKIMKK